MSNQSSMHNANVLPCFWTASQYIGSKDYHETLTQKYQQRKPAKVRLLLMFYLNKDNQCPVHKSSWTPYFPFPF